jgi:predicted short-subunit dehydrogenase-like oxidoreductase (DUF2520 family)
MPTLGILGAGRLGSSLALALEHAGHPITSVHSANQADAEALCRRLPGSQLASATELAERCDLVFMTVPDAAIATCADTIPWRAGQHVVHCSGALELSVLDAAGRAGALRGCLHPLQSFPERFGDPERWSGIVCGIEADEPLGAILERHAQALGADVVRLEGIDRARYHAAAVFASNYLVALHAAANEAWAAAGLPRALARRALGPLGIGTAERLARLSLEDALTGPLARGDTQTIAHHLRALATTPELRALYVQLARWLLKLALPLPDAQRSELETLFEAGEDQDSSEP